VTLLNQSIKVTRAGFAGVQERSGPGQGEKGPGDEKPEPSYNRAKRERDSDKRLISELKKEKKNGNRGFLFSRQHDLLSVRAGRGSLDFLHVHFLNRSIK
jgi:hypothetical protein